MHKAALILLFILNITALRSQNSFNGTIEYTNMDLVNRDTTDTMFNKVYSAMISKIFVSYSKNNVNIHSKGGFLEMVDYIFIDKKPEAYLRVDSFKVYTTAPVEEQKKRTIEKMDETLEILGHTCTKYKISVKDAYNDYTNYAWISSDLPIPSSTLLDEYGFDLFLQQIPYAVLKIQTFAGTYQATKITVEAPEAELFKIPKGYQLKKNMFRRVDQKKK